MGVKQRNCINVHTSNLPPAVYELMFTVVELKGNDLWYEITPSELYEYDFEEEWAERKLRGPHNCYYDPKEMQKLHDNWITYKEAVALFVGWLRGQDVDPDEELLVKVWW